MRSTTLLSAANDSSPRSKSPKAAAAVCILTASLLGGTAAIAPSAAAAPRDAAGTTLASTTVAISAYSPLHVPLNKPAVAAKGKVRNFPTGAKVRLQRKSNTSWSNVGTSLALSGGGAFQFKVTHSSEGFNTYRVQVFTSTKTLATSTTLSTHVHRFSGSKPRATGMESAVRPSASAQAAGVVNGEIRCYQFSSWGTTQVRPPYKVTLTNGIVYWVPQYYSSRGNGWQFEGNGQILYSSADGNGWTSYWWDLNTGNEVRVQTQSWNPGFYMAAFNLVSPGDQWYNHGYSPAADGSGNEFCAI